MPPGVTLLDAAMGTALLARGLPAGALPEEWLLERPEEIAAVHAEHAAAGAELVLTCTFNCAAPRLEARLDPARVEALCLTAVRVARSASRTVRVAGAVGPTGLARPLGPGVAAAVLEARYTRPLRALAAVGVELLWIESQHDLVEALTALRVARRTGAPAAVTFGFAEREGRLSPPAGAKGDAIAWLRAAEAAGASAVGVNCVFPGPSLDALARAACAVLRVPFVAKPSAGLPGSVLSPEAFAAAVAPAHAAGARIVGGCCGATGAHLRALRAALGGRGPG
jgi:5-methyltetrahydrofolate--homocysteine methyltransferase